MSSSLVLYVHVIIGILVTACAALFVWFRLGRRITIYLLSLQILVGFVMIVLGRQAHAPHYVLGVAGWAGYVGASYMERQADTAKNVLVLTILASLLVLLAAFLGARAAGVG